MSLKGVKLLMSKSEGRKKHLLPELQILGSSESFSLFPN